MDVERSPGGGEASEDTMGAAQSGREAVALMNAGQLLPDVVLLARLLPDMGHLPGSSPSPLVESAPLVPRSPSVSDRWRAASSPIGGVALPPRRSPMGGTAAQARGHVDDEREEAEGAGGGGGGGDGAAKTRGGEAGSSGKPSRRSSMPEFVVVAAEGCEFDGLAPTWRQLATK